MVSSRVSRLPPSMSINATGGPTFSTSLVETSGGFEQRNINWQNARRRYNLAPAIQNKDDLDFVLSFFQTHKGKAIGFRFKDWTDYKVINGLIGIGDGAKKIFEFCKYYDNDHNQYLRRINKVVNNKMEIFVNDTKIFPEIDFETARIIFKDPPKKDHKITASFEFDVYVRFDTDQLIINPDLEYINNLEIPIIEIKL